MTGCFSCRDDDGKMKPRMLSRKQRKIIHCNLMQAALGAVQNPRCAVVIHNVRSCSKVVWDAFRSLGEKCREITGNRKMDGFLFCTCLTDQDAVFGGNEKLRRCLEDICDEIHPEVILVVLGIVVLGFRFFA